MASAFERQLKRLGLTGVARLATPPRGAPDPQALQSVRRVLVVRPDERIGNAVLIIPLLNAIKQRFPGARLDCVMSRRYWDLREFIPAVDAFVPFDKKHYARNPFAFAGFIRRLRRARYDLVFDAAGEHEVSFTHLAITAFSGGRFRIGHARGEASGCYDVAVPVSAAPRHTVESHLDLLRSITAVDTDPRPLLKLTDDSGYARRLIHERGWSAQAPLIVLHPGARGRKRWPASSFAQVARDLAAAHSAHVVAVWGPSDTAAADEFLRDAGDSVAASGILPFRDFISLVRHADVFISADCGPMHLAAAAPPRGGIVTLFSTPTEAKYRPLGTNNIAIDASDARSTPAAVVKAVMQVLAAARPERLELAGARQGH